MIGPITILDNILNNNVDMFNKIDNNKKDTLVLSSLFSAILSDKEFSGNQYILRTFEAFTMSKQKIEIHIGNIDQYCMNKDILDLIFFGLVKINSNKQEGQIIMKNVLKPCVLKMFKKVTHVEIRCSEYKLSPESLLLFIHETQIEQIVIYAENWSLSSFVQGLNHCSAHSNYNTELENGDTILRINYLKTPQIDKSWITPLDSSSIPTMDLSIFNQIESPPLHCKHFKSCACIKRLLTVVKYHSLLQIHSHRVHQSVFNDFIYLKYNLSQLVMDQYHLQKKHDQEVHQIMQFAANEYKFAPCNINTCLSSSRLYRVHDEASKLKIFDKEDEESILPVYIDIIDGIHHFIFHVFQCGLRDIGDTKSDQDSDKHYKGKGDEYYDETFAKMSARIRAKRTNTQRFDRMNGANRFNINLGNDDLFDKNDGDNDNETYLDSISANLENEGIEERVIQNLANYIMNEQFESETIDLDLQIVPNGNIESHFKDEKSIKRIKKMFEKTASMLLKSQLSISSSCHALSSNPIYFSASVQMRTFFVGFDWKYWKSDRKYDDEYVSPRFIDFKAEIMEYKQIHNIRKVYQTVIHKKAREYRQTNLVKSLTSKSDEYGLSEGDAIPIDYLICIILYTDYGDLSTHFSASFRARHKYEPISASKRRNTYYYWLSKGLKELIALFGQNYRNASGALNKLQGSFFTGMSFVLTMSDFLITIFGPVSTSVHKEVAMRFGQDTGMLIEIDNTTRGRGEYANGFDVSLDI